MVINVVLYPFLHPIKGTWYQVQHVCTWTRDNRAHTYSCWVEIVVSKDSSATNIDDIIP